MKSILRSVRNLCFVEETRLKGVALDLSVFIMVTMVEGDHDIRFRPIVKEAVGSLIHVGADNLNNDFRTIVRSLEPNTYKVESFTVNFAQTCEGCYDEEDAAVPHGEYFFEESEQQNTDDHLFMTCDNVCIFLRSVQD